MGALTGNVTGNVSGTSGSTTGNAATATALATARTIGGTSFDGTANIVPATAVAVTGSAQSAITSLGTLTSLTVDTTVLDSYIISQNTSDGSDNSQLSLAGGGADSDGRGARARLYGNEHSSKGGDVDISTGNIANAQMDLYATGNFTVDAGGEIILDADAQGSGNGILLKDAGTLYGSIFRSSSHLHIKSEAQDKHILFMGNDGGNEITALTLDMENAGRATFNERINFGTHMIGSMNGGYLQVRGTGDRYWVIGSTGGNTVPTTASATLGFHHYDGSSWTQNSVNITASGKLCIGTDNPDRDLHIKGSGNNVGIQIEKTGAHELRVAIDSTGPYLYAEGTAPLRFYQNNAETIRISDNNVGIGTNNPTKKLHVVGDANEGIYLKAGAQIAYAPTSSDFYNGLTLENLGSGHAFSIGYGQGARLKFSYFDNSSTYEELATMRPGGDFYPTGSVVMANGEGISFSATAGPTHTGSGSSELLNDYEQGTWTPTIESYNGNSVTTSGTFSGWYIKVGQKVTVLFKGDNFTFTGSNGTDLVGITLPFNPTAGIEGGGNAAFHGLAASGRHLMPLVISTGNALMGFIGSNNNNGSWTWPNFNEVGSGNTSFRGTFTYFL